MTMEAPLLWKKNNSRTEDDFGIQNFTETLDRRGDRQDTLIGVFETDI